MPPPAPGRRQAILSLLAFAAYPLAPASAAIAGSPSLFRGRDGSSLLNRGAAPRPAPTAEDAKGQLSHGGRTLNLVNAHTGESLRTTYRSDEGYDRAALDQLDVFFRDWRRDEVHKMDVKVLDVLWEAHRRLDTTAPIRVLSAYRSPETNRMLRRRSAGVARNSLHLKGMAVDWCVEGRSVAQIYDAACACRGGGVGRYSASGFVHVDSGSLRSWGA